MMHSPSSSHIRRVIARHVLAFLFIAGLLGASVGSTAALFGLLNSFVFNPVPGNDGERVIHAMGLSFRPGGENGLEAWGRAPGLERISTYVNGVGELETAESWRPIRASVVSSDFFAVFGVTPVAGRGFRGSDQDAQPFGTAIISHALWRGFYASSPSVVSNRLRLSNGQYVVVGIAPPGFDYPAGTEIWLSGLVRGVAVNALRSQPPQLFSTGPASGWVARLRADVSVQQASEQLRTIHASLKQQFPKAQLGDSIRVRALRDVLSQQIRPALSLFLAGSVVVLLIAAVNGGILFSVLVAAQMRDVAIMRALGATTSTLLGMVGQVLALLWVATVGLAIGLGLLILKATDVYSPLFSVHLPERSTLVGAMVVAALGFATVAVALVAFIPYLQVPRANVAGFLQDWAIAPRSRSDTPRRYVFTAVQVGLSVLLVLVALLSTRTLLRLETLELGFEPDEALVVETRIPASAPAAYVARQRELLAALATVPGVRAVGAASDLPVSAARAGLWLERGKARVFCGRYLIAGTYLPAMGIPLVAGRSVQDSELGVVVISERVVRQLWTEGQAVGDSLWLPDDKRAVQVVGVAKDTPPLDLGAADTSCQVYLPYGELSEGTRASLTPVVARCAGACTEHTVNALRQTITSGYRSSAGQLVTLGSVVDHALNPARFRASLSLLYAALGAALAMLGTYALISQMALQRAKEVGLRMTMGAGYWNVVRLLTAKSLVATLLGTLGGALAAFLLARVIKSLIFGVATVDALSIVLAAVVLIVCGSIAAALPALRLARRPPSALMSSARGGQS